MSTKTILITGCNGFAGSHLTRFFLDQFEVHGADVSTSTVHPINYHCIDRHQPEYKSIFRNHQFDWCINAGGNGSVAFSLENPDLDFKMNVENVRKLLEAISETDKNCRFIQMSSAAVYGNLKKTLWNEQDDLQPISPYGINKLKSENLCKEYYEKHGVKSLVLRIFSLYGPGLRKQLLWDFYQRLCANTSVTMHGTGNEERDFLFITDFVQIVNDLMKNENSSGQTLNIATGTATKVSDVLHLIKKISGEKTEINFNGIVREGDPVRMNADITALKKIIHPQFTNPEVSLSKTVAWMNSEKKN